MIVVGIDPGIAGGIVAVDSWNKVTYKSPTPILKVGSKTICDARMISSMVKELSPDMVILERVGAMPGQGVTSMFSFGYSAGMLEGIVAALGLPYRLVLPQVWMKDVLSGYPKGEGGKGSVLFCKRMWPSVDWRATQRSFKPHDGMTDAACLAYYGIKNL